MLTTGDFGAVAYALTLMLMLSSLAEWGFDSGLIRGASAQPALLARYYLGAQAWKTILFGPVLVIAVVVTVLVRPTVEQWVLMALMLLAGFPELWSHTARAVASSRQVPGGVSTALVLQRLVTGLAIIGALVAGWGPVGVAAGFLLGTLVGWTSHRRALHPLVDALPVRALSREDLRLAARATFLIGLSGLVLMLLFRLDVVLLGYFKGDEGVAVYSVAYRLLETLLFVAFAINQAVLPVMSATASPERRRSGYERAMSVAGFIYVPFFVVSLLEGRAILDLLFGTRYGDPAAPALAWLAAAPVFYAAAFFGTSLLISLHRNRTLLFATVTALVVNVVLNLILIPPYGPAGAAAATTAAYGIQTLVSVGSLRQSGEKPRVFVPLLPAAAACVPLAALLLVLDLPVLVELVLGGLCYLGVWLLVVRRVAPEQVQIVRQLLTRRRAGAPADG